MEKIKKGVLGAVLLLAVMLFSVTLSFATEHYVIETSSSVSNQTYTGFNQTEEYYNGGVFYVQQGATLTINSSKIYNNSVSTTGYTYGGAIYNDKGFLNIYDTDFSSNTARFGGAISNNGGTTEIGSNIQFSSNNAVIGGGVYNTGVTNIGSSVTFVSNMAGNVGGAIRNYGGQMEIGEYATFISNNSQYGGAIDNFGTDEDETKILKIGSNAKFIENKVQYTGGAIMNGSKMQMIIGQNAEFNSNIAGKEGGAISNSGANLTILSGTKFINNLVQNVFGSGGAIYNAKGYGFSGILNLIAEFSDIEFTGNTAGGISNAIHDEFGTINMWTSDIANIVFNDRITSEDNTSIMNINKSSGTLPATGKVILNEDMTGYKGEVNLYNGTIVLGEKGTLFGGKIYVDNATIDFASSIIKEHNFKDLTVNNRLNLIVNADLENKKMDTIYADSFSGAGTINVKKINILADTENTVEILFTSSTVLQEKITSTPTASSALYKYDVIYNSETGFFSFINTESAKRNPAIVSGAVASAAGGFTTQKAIIDQSFASLNNFASKKVQTKANINRNLYASASNKVFESENKIERGLWIRPYASQDTVKIGDADIDNTLYGTLAGIDLPVSEDKQVSFYIGYAGSKQDIEEIKVTQTGYIAGASGMLIKDKWYAGLTANINFNKAESDINSETDEFDMNMYAIAAKAGYDIEAGKNWTIEPNIMLIYGSVNRQEYTTKQGAKIKEQSDNNIIISPQVKAKLDLDKGLKPYALLGYVLNAGDKIKAEADGLETEGNKADGYVEYGIGLNKDFINTPWSCYVQVTGKGGDRSGFDGSFGVKYNF